MRAAECSDSGSGGLPALSEECRTTSFNLGLLVSQLCFPDLLPEDGKCQTPKLQRAHPGTLSWHWENAAAWAAIGHLLPKLSQGRALPSVPAEEVSSKGPASSFRPPHYIRHEGPILSPIDDRRIIRWEGRKLEKGKASEELIIHSGPRAAVQSLPLAIRGQATELTSGS